MRITSDFNETKSGNIFLRRRTHLVVIALLATAFAGWLMFSTFSYSDGQILISDKVWSDFSSHIPLIRSFSLGGNMPPEFPLFSGEKIRYHFLFYFVVGLLEKAGIRIDYALNLPSTIGLAGMLTMLYWFTVRTSKSIFAGYLSVIFTLFNSSFSWIYLVLEGRVSPQIFSEVANSRRFLSFGPYDGGMVSAFWNLNIFTNQRHFALALALLFLVVWALLYNRRWASLIAAVAVIGLMSWLHKAVLIVIFAILGLALIFPGKRRRAAVMFFFGLIAALPGLFFLNGGGILPAFQSGFLYKSAGLEAIGIFNPWGQWVGYWILNLGLLPVVAFGGWMMVRKSVSASNLPKTWRRAWLFISDKERILGWAGLAAFAAANLFMFNPDISANHKLVNFTILAADIYAAVFVAGLFRGRVLYKVSGGVLCLLLTLGGVVDFFPIQNHGTVVWNDINRDGVAVWILKNTNPEDRFLNLTYETGSITVAGRRIFWGWDYFAWSAGYDMESRKRLLQPVVSGRSTKSETCDFLNRNQLRYIYIDVTTKTFLGQEIERDFFARNFNKVSPGDFQPAIYEVVGSCQLKPI